MHNEPNKHTFTCELQKYVKGASQVHIAPKSKEQSMEVRKARAGFRTMNETISETLGMCIKTVLFWGKKSHSILSLILILFILVSFQKMFLFNWW